MIGQPGMHPYSERAADLYETPSEATEALLRAEGWPPSRIWEPCAGAAPSLACWRERVMPWEASLIAAHEIAEEFFSNSRRLDDAQRAWIIARRNFGLGNRNRSVLLLRAAPVRERRLLRAIFRLRRRRRRLGCTGPYRDRARPIRGDGRSGGLRRPRTACSRAWARSAARRADDLRSAPRRAAAGL